MKKLIKKLYGYFSHFVSRCKQTIYYMNTCGYTAKTAWNKAGKVIL